MLVALALSSVLALSATADDGNRGDPSYGKTLTPTNFAVVPGIFIQDDPSFTGKNYNMLNDSFGLIDKSDDRWVNLTKLVTYFL